MSHNSCTYVLKRGKNKGQQCNSKCLENTQYCKKHSSKDTDESSDISIQSFDSKADHSLEEKPTQNLLETETSVRNTVQKSKPKSKEKKEKEPKEKKEKPKSKEKSKSKDEKETSIKVEVYERKKINATRNKHGNFVLENNLIVHPVNRKIIGRQEDDKTVEISIEDIEYCKEHGYCYEQPSVMYFRNPDIEKEEMKLQKLLKSKKLESQGTNENDKTSLNSSNDADVDDELEDDISENELDSEEENDD